MHVLAITDTPWHEDENESLVFQEEERPSEMPRFQVNENGLHLSWGWIRLIACVLE